MKKRFNGPIGEQIKQHLKLRKSLGFIYRSSVYSLDAFDLYLAKYFPCCETISREMIIGYLDSIHYLQPISRQRQITNLRQFCRFMFQFDQNTYIPEKNLVNHAEVKVKPHIFTEEEIFKLIEQAKNIRCRNTLLPHTYATIIALLWVTGMRIGEVVKLKIEDIDMDNGIICVRQTKFFKSRLIPLSASSTQALIAYKNRRAGFGYSKDPDAPFFLNHRGKPCITATTPRTIKEFIIRTGIKTIQGKTPRCHDIRHSFATRCLLGFYQIGKDPTAYLPVLATYLGHASIANTQVYLHPSIELLNIAGQKLQAYTDSISGENYETNK